MKNSILYSKINIPKLSKNFINRERLTDKILNLNCQIIIVQATIGYGKSVLITQAMKKFDGIVAWIQLDEDDSEIYKFSMYVIETLKKALESIDMFDSASNYQNETDNFYEQEILDLILKINENMDKIGKIAIVIEDLHYLKNQNIINLLDKIVNNSNENIKFIFSTRSIIHSFIVKKIVAGDGYILSETSLKFNYDEVFELTKLILKSDNNENEAKNIYEYTEGWPVACMLLMISNKIYPEKFENKQFVYDKKLLKDYFINGYFKKLPYEIQNFLINTCILDVLSVSVCNEILKIKNSGSILEYLVQENIFTTKISSENNIYRYHSFIKNVLENYLSDDKKIENIKIAANYYLTQKERKKAVELAMKINEVSIIEYALKKDFSEMMKSNQLDILSKWMEFLLNSNVSLQWETYLLISIYNLCTGEVEDAFKYVMNSEKIFLNNNDLSNRDNKYIYIITAKAAILRCLNKTTEAIEILNNVKINDKAINANYSLIITKEKIRCLMAMKEYNKALKLCKKEIEYNQIIHNGSNALLLKKLLIGIYYYEQNFFEIINIYDSIKNEENIDETRIYNYIDYVAIAYLTLGKFDNAINLLENQITKENEIYDFPIWSHNLILSFIMMAYCIIKPSDERKSYYNSAFNRIKITEHSLAPKIFYSQMFSKDDNVIIIDRDVIKNMWIKLLIAF